jgi:predicted nuclease of restriction endonuclease-like (RecB) superfamily
MGDDIAKHAGTIISMIEEARRNALQSVNVELIKLYWQIGEYLSEQSAKSSWGDSFIDETAKFIKEKHPAIKGFTRRGLYRMLQFYETYRGNEFVSTLLTQIGWSNHLLILSGAKSIEEKEFYIGLCVREKYTYRELDRQIKSAYYERYMLSSKSVAPVPVLHNENARFLDSYVLEFLNLPNSHSENDLKRAIIRNMKGFVLEIGCDFSFVGEEYRLQVGNADFYIDLLFYHRGLSCLVAFELKLDKFQPEYIGKMNFYLEALDRDHRKPNENPSIGVILCASKDNDVVEYAMSRSMSPTMVSQYNLQLIDKRLLEQKLGEFRELLPNGDNAGDPALDE